MTIDKKYIRNDAIRAEAESLASQFAQYAGEAFKKRFLTFHGVDTTGAWKVWNRDEVPSYALTSDVTYWLAKDGFQSLASRWWDVCDILTAYVLRSARTGKTYDQAPNDFINAISIYGFDAASVKIVCSTFANHISDIPFGSYLYNPASVLHLAKGGSGKGLLLAGVGVLGAVGLVKMMQGKKRR